MRLDVFRSSRREILIESPSGTLLVDYDLDEHEINKAGASQEARIRQAAQQGALAVERGAVRFGDLMDWAGREVMVIPEWGTQAQVLPDGLEDYIHRVNRFREQLFAAIAPNRAPRHGRAPDWAQLIGSIGDAVASGLKESWGVVLALDAALASAAEDLDGEPVVHAETVIQLEEVR